jgi:DNA-binding transcriptional MerR regulator
MGTTSIYIKQAAQMVGISAATIRAWERQGLIKTRRTAAGYRLYTQADVERLRRIRDLFQVDGLNAAGVRQMLRLSGEDAPPLEGKPSGDSDGLGMRIRRLRRRQGISLRQLATRTGLSPSYISSLERSHGRPSIASLQKLAAALGTNLSLMLGDESASSAGQLVVRPHQRRKLHLDTPGILMEQLAVEEQDLEPTVVRISPGCGSEDSYHHEGEEFIFVLDGTFEITLEETGVHVLEPGDAITFRSHRPHRWRNPGTSETILIWVNTPPTF